MPKEQEKGPGMLPHIWCLEIPVRLWLGSQHDVSMAFPALSPFVNLDILCWEIWSYTVHEWGQGRGSHSLPREGMESRAIAYSKLAPETTMSGTNLLWFETLHLLPTLGPVSDTKSSSYLLTSWTPLAMPYLSAIGHQEKTEFKEMCLVSQDTFCTRS